MGMGSWVKAALTALLGLVAFGPVPAAASGAVTGTPVPVCVRAAQPGDDPLALIRSARGFDCDRAQTDFGSGDFWAISDPIAAPSATNEPLRVRVDSQWQKSLDLYVLHRDGQVTRYQADDRHVGRHVTLGAMIEQTVPSRGVTRLMWHVRGSANVRGILTGARIATQAQSASADLTMGAFYAGFAGLCIALIVYNLALFWALRYPFQLAYCAMVVGLLAHAYSASGALAWTFPDMPNTLRLRINYLLLGFNSAAALAFARMFFDVRVFAGWAGRVINFEIGLVLALAAGFFVLAPYDVTLAHWIYTLCYLGMTISLVPILVHIGRAKTPYFWVFTLAWSTPFVSAVARALAAAGVIGNSFWLDNSTIVAMTIESILSSVAIAHRLRVLTRERDDARTGEIIARRLAETDPLTGLLNRRAFLARAIGREGPQTLTIVDIDHFKQVNETIGHDGGDEVLRAFSRTLSTTLPPEALLARIGGEEFAIVTDADATPPPASILARLRATPMPYDLSVTASIGTCTGRLSNEPDWKRLYRGADTALFSAKAAGRDRARDAAGIATAA